MKSFLRVWEFLDLDDIEKHLFVLGELSGECFSCHKIGLKLPLKECPNCHTQFRYIGFRRKVHPSLIDKLKKENPQFQLIDFDDFKRALSRKEAKKFLDI